ncbi:ABC transporter ATP-binding protein [Pseudoramibacter faecis]|uniref:ABC transporter ATP-binding protein n=1 Tax=Pseudoramibacter faecis TaxID=3108534 RepID=UPI002E7937AE|nr:ABC transporter ATP-binding protein [Pseudoramibacter sp. HA2172]
MNIITIKDLCFQYEAAAQGDALKNVNLQVKQGECLVLTGESGCGKTTLLRCLNGLIPEFYEGKLSGELFFRETSYEGLEQYEVSAHISTVFQDPRSQFFTVNSTDEIAFGCENLSLSTERINENVENAFSHLNIGRLKDRSLFMLSSGEKQKLAIASVYAMSTDVILLDEPTANLDESSIQDIRKMLSALKAEGKTLIVSEHRLSWLDGIADRYVYMAKGEIQQIWSAENAKQLSEDDLRQYGLRSLCEYDIHFRSDSSDSGENELSCEGLTVSYGRQRIIRDMTFRFSWGKQGKIVGIVGKNGSGKTTLAKTLCGLLTPSDGIITLNGKKVGAKELCKSAYMVIQDADYQLFTESVLHEIQLADRKRQSKRRKADPQKITELLNRFGLEGYKDRHPLSLSGGQKQRVTIAAALAAGADILVLDEPTSGLDGRNMQNLKEALRKIKAQGKLILIVTHDAEFLNDLTDQTIVLS